MTEPETCNADVNVNEKLCIFKIWKETTDPVFDHGATTFRFESCNDTTMENQDYCLKHIPFHCTLEKQKAEEFKVIQNESDDIKNDNAPEESSPILVEKNTFDEDKINNKAFGNLSIMEEQKTLPTFQFPDIFQLNSQIYERVTTILTKKDCQPNVMHTFLLFPKRQMDTNGDADGKLMQLALGWNDLFQIPSTQRLFQDFTYCENEETNKLEVKVKMTSAGVPLNSVLSWNKDKQVYYNMMYYWVLVKENPKTVN